MKTITQQTLATNYRYNRPNYSLGMDKFWTRQFDCSFLTVSASTQFVQRKCILLRVLVVRAEKYMLYI